MSALGQKQTFAMQKVILDQLIGASEQLARQGQTERFGGFQVDQELELGRLINRNVARFASFENLVHVIGHAPEQLRKIDGIAHERAGFDVIAVRTHRR